MGGKKSWLKQQEIIELKISTTLNKILTHFLREEKPSILLMIWLIITMGYSLKEVISQSLEETEIW